MNDPDLDELASELSEFSAPEKKGGRSPREERVIAGFEEIQRFFAQYGRAPQHGEDRDIFERVYAVRLDRLRALPDCRSLLVPLDHQGLLAGGVIASEPSDAIDVYKLAAELAGVTGADDINVLRHVRTSAEKRAAEEIAAHTPCRDFEDFKPLFQEVETGLKEERWQTKPFGKDASIEVGDFFILAGQIAYVAEMGDTYKTPNAETNGRLRVIYSNGTESDLLLRSLQRALYKDSDGKAGRRLVKVDDGPLFSNEIDDDDQQSGTIYVVRSKSELPAVAAHREVLHKIGVTGRSNIAARFSGAKYDPTFLLADVEIVATYDLYNIDRVRLESLIHRVFSPARMDVEIKDRFGNPVVPREWFLVPLFIVDEAVKRIADGSITQYVYDPKAVQLVKMGATRET
ncbi:GIY-YIG nuclease family protein [Caenimonas aquaedulcis]|uniref:GIY-YIG nuclease family protein n=1 Tax=Caenimonas aquaedulcis TaxID=2793270 RepID=A0A931H4B6_9BURK|nr:GIY-YIG nuclease family protein [Caenimonas aquaedulcis]MBG9388374.1 GIY-YIG nuclease family protein [Caenimonas aquaedulcis]